MNILHGELAELAGSESSVPGVNIGTWRYKLEVLLGQLKNVIIAFELSLPSQEKGFIFGLSKIDRKNIYRFEIVGLYIPESMRKKGHGRMLVKEFENKAKDIAKQQTPSPIYITVDTVEKSYQFWLRNGYNTQTIIPNFPGKATLQKEISL